MKTLKQRYDYIIQTYIDQFCAKHTLEYQEHDDEGAVLSGAYYTMRKIRESMDGVAPERMKVVRRPVGNKNDGRL